MLLADVKTQFIERSRQSDRKYILTLASETPSCSWIRSSNHDNHCPAPISLLEPSTFTYPPPPAEEKTLLPDGNCDLHPTGGALDIRVPETDEETTHKIWEDVRHNISHSAHMDARPHHQQPTAASQLRRSARSQRTLPSTYDGTSTASSVASSKKTKKNPVAGEEDFRARVFPRYGIVLQHGQTVLLSPYQYFKTEDPRKVAPEMTLTEWYQQNHPDCHSWLELPREPGETEVIRTQLARVLKQEANEAKLSLRAKMYFFKEDILPPKSNPSRYSCTGYMVETHPNPDGDKLLAPPAVGEGLEHAFLGNPDLTWFNTLMSFHEEYRQLIHNEVPVHFESDAIAPFFTIEFKKKHKDEKEAVDQMAAAVTLNVYNRYLQRLRRLQVWGAPFAAEQFADLDYFGCTYCGESVQIFRARPRLSFETPSNGDSIWQGCEIATIHRFRTNENGQIMLFASWINEIINYGIGKYKENFTLDVKGILHQREGGERVSLVPEELQRLSAHQP